MTGSKLTIGRLWLIVIYWYQSTNWRFIHSHIFTRSHKGGLTIGLMVKTPLAEMYKQIRKLNLKLQLKKIKVCFCFYHFFILSIILKFWVFWNYLQNKKIIKTKKPSFSYLTLTFSMICLLLRVLDEFHYHLKWYQSKWTRGTQLLSYPALFNLKLSREELQGKASRKSDIDEIVFNEIHLMVKKYMYENLKHTVKKHLSKKIKKYSHFQAITTNNSKNFRFYIKQYWHFHWVIPKQY